MIGVHGRNGEKGKKKKGLNTLTSVPVGCGYLTNVHDVGVQLFFVVARLVRLARNRIQAGHHGVDNPLIGVIDSLSRLRLCIDRDSGHLETQRKEL